MFEKCEVLNFDKEKFLLYAKDDTISVFKFNKNLLEEKTKVKLDCSIIYIEILPKDERDLIFLISLEYEWAVLDLSLSILCEGKFSSIKQGESIKGVCWNNSNSNLILALKRNFIVHFSLRHKKNYRGFYSQLPIFDDIHWPSLCSRILDICLVKGSNSKDYAVIYS